MRVLILRKFYEFNLLVSVTEKRIEYDYSGRTPVWSLWNYMGV